MDGGSPLTATTIGAKTAAADVFLRVTVESKVSVDLFSTNPDRVIANWLVMSCGAAPAAPASRSPSAIRAHVTRFAAQGRTEARRVPRWQSSDRNDAIGRLVGVAL